MKKNKGITLVALVVTIVVLLILAGVSINLVLGNNGIIAKAKDAETKSAEARENDLKGMNSLIEQMESTLNGSGNGGKTEPETVPYLPSDDFHYDTSTSIDTGLVIKDANGNEYVWVVVPRTIAVYKTTGLGKTTFTDADYTSIENDLKEYTKTYRGSTSYSDTYTADDKNVGWFADETAYNNFKNSMLKSVYENGGFYVGRYEAGIGTNRTSIEEQVDGKYPVPTTVPVTKADAYPYTYVTRTQAQNLANNVNSGNKTSSLMFGVQWDLVLAFMSRDTAKINQNTLSELTSNSTTIGNYNNNLWEIKNVNAKYLSNGKFVQCSNPYKKESNSNILLTTGADDSFSVQNIYDIAGNVWEWTLEKTSDTSGYCARRGGSYNNIGSAVPATFRGRDNMTYAHYSIGFRVALW